MATTLAARDAMKDAPPIDSDVQRRLVVADPPLAGPDVESLQRAVRERLKERGIGPGDVPVPVHGRFDAATMLACIEAQYALGLRAESYLLRDNHDHRVVSEVAQRVIRRPETRDPEQLERAQARHDQLERGPRFYAQLAGDMGMTGNGPMSALAYAATHVGIKEKPAGSGCGPAIDEWCRLAGYRGPVPWGGCFVNACLVAGGLPSGAGWGIGFAPSIVAHARSGAGGWSWHDGDGLPGDLALFGDGDGVVHVELVRRQLSPTRYSTYGGNTGPGSTGGRSDGGTVARHDDRSTTSAALRIIGFARPPWQR